MNSKATLLLLGLALSASFLLPTSASLEEDVILESPTITNEGSWGVLENCPEGSFVTAFQLKVEPKCGCTDDTGLNGIRFFCESGPGQNKYNLTSTVGEFGDWESILNCPNSTYAIGFNLEVVPPRGPFRDDKAATNFKLICSNALEIEGYSNENETKFGGAKYSGARKCPTGTGICGLQTQVEPPQAGGDDTALNNVRVNCCSN